MPTAEKRPTVSGDLNIKLEEPALPNYLVIDGRISYSSLNELNKDEKWLFYKLDLKSDQTLKDIILAIYDSKTDEITTHFKDKNS